VIVSFLRILPGRKDDYCARISADNAGRFGLWLEPGVYRLEFRAPAGGGEAAPETRRIELSTREPRDLAFTLPRPR
jgi:hypothetical protein